MVSPHNEADEPAATQPLMYQVIRAHKTTRELYAAQLEAKGVIQPGQNSNFTAQFGRDIIKLRIKLTCKIAK